MIKELPNTIIVLPLEIAGISAKIHGWNLTKRKGAIVSWNNIEEFFRMGRSRAY